MVPRFQKMIHVKFLSTFYELFKGRTGLADPADQGEELLLLCAKRVLVIEIDFT